MNRLKRLIHAKVAFEDAGDFAQKRKQVRWNNRLMRINNLNDPYLQGQMHNRIRGRIGGT
jgi:hypothetical protein